MSGCFHKYKTRVLSSRFVSRPCALLFVITFGTSGFLHTRNQGSKRSLSSKPFSNLGRSIKLFSRKNFGNACTYTARFDSVVLISLDFSKLSQVYDYAL